MAKKSKNNKKVQILIDDTPDIDEIIDFNNAKVIPVCIDDFNRILDRLIHSTKLLMQRNIEDAEINIKLIRVLKNKYLSNKRSNKENEYGLS